MTIEVPKGSLLPFTKEQLASLEMLTRDLNSNQLSWLSGYFWSMVNKDIDTITESLKVPIESSTIITLLSASQTGNARRLAEQIRDDLSCAKLSINLVNAREYQFKKIAKEKILIVITSTYGEGEPPEEAIVLYKFLMSQKAPNLANTAFAVFGLGDSSYKFFSQIGKNFDNRLAALGAERLLERVDADLEYNEQAKNWGVQLIKILKERVLIKYSAKTSIVNTTSGITEIKKNMYTKDIPFNTNITINQKITGRNSNRDVRHIEIDISNSNIYYTPGDALGVWYENDIALVEEIMQLVCLKGDELIKFKGCIYPLVDMLQKCLELTVNTTKIIKEYALLSHSEVLLELAHQDNKKQLQRYAESFPIVDMLRQAPSKLNPEQLTKLLRPLKPRLYSISSAQSENENEVHITIGVVRYKINGRVRGGGASTWLSNQFENGKIRIFIEHNDNFRLPFNSNALVIMIAAGTGIAPFRAFMQQRNHDGTDGKNWLFFGNQHFTEDFLYQIEWQKYVKDGLLNNIDLAWSRDQEEKIYVQDKIIAKGEEIWEWIQKGTYIYVCGSAKHMAQGVEQALLYVIIKYGNMDGDAANEFLNQLRIERRYQREIY